MNRKCAVGHLIPDDKYHPDMEGRGVHRLDLVALELDGHLPLLAALEEAHDTARSPEEMQLYLERVAEKYNLGVPGSYMPET